MSKFENFSSKLNEEWCEFQKQFVKVSNQTANETAGAAAEVLKGLAKELGTLGERLEKWVETAKKPAADQPQQQPQGGQNQQPPQA
jgi:hypothetical protein